MNVLAFLILISVFKATEGMYCHRYILETGKYLKECYFYIKSDVMLDFEDASSACNRYGGTLPPFYDDKYMGILVHHPLQTWPGEKNDIAAKIWLGVTDQLMENQWLQPNGDIANISSKTSWWSDGALNQSTADEYDCVTMNTNTFLWEDRNCSEKNAAGMICTIPNTASGSSLRKGTVNKYFRRPSGLNGYVFPEILFSRAFSDLESCATYGQQLLNCRAVVWTPNKICFAYERVITNADIRIPLPYAMLFNMNDEKKPEDDY